MTYDYDGTGKEREVLFSAYTLMVYEHEFKTGLIEDVYGRISLPKKNGDETLIADYTRDNWESYMKALWAGLRAGSDFARAEMRPHDVVEPYEKWSMTAMNINLAELASFILNSCNDAFFRPRTTGEEDAEEGEDE